MIIVPLGVASATPTAKRHLSSVAVWRDGSVFLFDCGENAQMRALQAGIKRSKIDYIFISHLDGDHFFGLPGLISTMQLQRRENDLHIVGPAGLKEFIEAALKAANIDLSFDIHFTEIEDGFEHQIVVDHPDYYVECRPLEHKSLCIGYRLQEKDKPGKVNAERAKELGITEDGQYKDLKAGKDVTLADGTVVAASEIVGEAKKGHSFAYVTDTLFSVNALKLAYKATLLYHEATFDLTLKDKAEETYHSTAHDAATIAAKAEVERLVITHFSARYTNQFVLLKEARRIFRETWVATELRPIMTDPEHERGIIKAKVRIESSSPSQGRGGSFNRRSSGRPPYRGGGSGGYGQSRDGGGRQKFFRPRRPYDNQGGGGGYDNRGAGGGGGRYDDRAPRRYDDRRSGGYDNRSTGSGPGRPYDNRGSRPPYDNRGGGGGGYNPGRPGGYDNRGGSGSGGYDNRGGGGGGYDNRGGGGRYDDRGGQSRPPYEDRGRRYDNRDPRDNRDSRDSRDPRDNKDFRKPDNRDNQDFRKPDYRDRDYRSKDKDRDKESDQSNLPITPRTPFDDFDRF